MSLAEAILIANIVEGADDCGVICAELNEAFRGFRWVFDEESGKVSVI